MKKLIIVSLMGCFLSVGALCAMEEVIVEKMKMEEADLNAQGKYVWSDNVEIRDLLIEGGAELSVRDKSRLEKILKRGINPEQALEEDYKLLIENGANINVQDGDGYTALIWAAKNSHTEARKALLEKGDDLNVRDAAGTTKLMRAAQEQADHDRLAEGLEQEEENNDEIAEDVPYDHSWLNPNIYKDCTIL